MPGDAVFGYLSADRGMVIHRTICRNQKEFRKHPDRYVDHLYGETEAGGSAWMYLSGVPFEDLGFDTSSLITVDHLNRPIDNSKAGKY